MKRRVIEVLMLCALILVALSSCSLEEALDAMMGNKYIEMGWAELDTSNADNVNKAVGDMGADESSKNAISDDGKLDLSQIGSMDTVNEALKNAGISDTTITISDSNLVQSIKDYGILAAQDKDQKQDLNNSISQALAGSASREAFSNQMKESATAQQSAAAKNSMAVTSEIINTVKDQLATQENETVNTILETLTDLQNQLTEKASSSETLSKAEVLQVQMITNMVTSAANVAGLVTDGGSSSPETIIESNEARELLNDASLLSNTSKALSGDVDLIQVPGLTDLISAFMDDSSSGSSSEPAARMIMPLAVALDASGTGDGSLNQDDKGNWYIDDPFYAADVDDAVEEKIRAGINFGRNFFEDALGITATRNGASFDSNEVRVRLSAFKALANAYDVMYSFGDLQAFKDNNESLYQEALGDYSSTSKALDYLLAILLSSVDQVLMDKCTDYDLGQAIADFYSLNEWIYRGSMIDGDLIYIPDEIVTAFKLTNNQDESAMKSLVDSLIGPESDLRDSFKTKAVTLDKMMIVGNFSVQDILDMVGAGDVEGDEEITSVSEYLENALKDLDEWLGYPSSEEGV